MNESMPVKKDASEKKQTLVLADRGRLTLDGVIHVESFEEDFLSLATCAGGVEIEGHGLCIEDLSKERGTILVVGNITAFRYTDHGAKEKKSRFSLFQ